MRNDLIARELVETTAARAGIPTATIERLFRDVPLDFRVIVPHGGLWIIQRFGMIAITLFGTVYIAPGALARSPESLLALMRHEATHIRQQRADRLFYIRYITQWIRRLLPLLLRSDAGALRDRWIRAYRMIDAETEAYESERLLLAELRAAP